MLTWARHVYRSDRARVHDDELKLHCSTLVGADPDPLRDARPVHCPDHRRAFQVISSIGSHEKCPVFLSPINGRTSARPGAADTILKTTGRRSQHAGLQSAGSSCVRAPALRRRDERRRRRGGRAAGPAESQRRAGSPASPGGGRRRRRQRVRLLQDEAELLPGRRYPGVRRLPVVEWRAVAWALVATARRGMVVVDR